MKIITTDAKSELSKKIYERMKELPDGAQNIKTPEDLARRLQEGDVCVVVKATGEEYRLRTGVREAKFEERLQNIIITAGIPPHVQGFRYLKDAVKLAYDNPRLINMMTKGMYPKIAERNETSASKVERAIRNAIDISSNRGRIENLNKELNVNVFRKGDKPTNSELIALIADRMLIEFGM